MKIITSLRIKSYLISSAIILSFSLLGIYSFSKYGIFLFILIPFLIGYLPVKLMGYYEGFDKRESLKSSLYFSVLTLCLFLVLGIEGLICILMSIPIIAICGFIGCLVAYQSVRKTRKKQLSIVTLVCVSCLFVGFVEPVENSKIYSVTSSVEINSTQEKIWNLVIAFPKLGEPVELMFKSGISYPIEATIEGKGVGAIRYCKFNTGDFVEPITVWDKPHKLAFDVKENPIPMNELSFWDIDAPHLHDYFKSEKGQFELKKLPNGIILLEGTTWYSQKIKPDFYWNMWSDYIVHKIHNRVLNHIKSVAERS
jgi:hypothetical protein